MFLSCSILSTYGQTDTTWQEPVVPVMTHPRIPLSPLTDPFPYGAYQHRIEFDSSSGNIELYEELLGIPYGQSRTLTLEEYIRRRQEEERQRMWEERAQQYRMYAPDEQDSGLTPKALLDSLLAGGGPPSIKIPLPSTFRGLFGDPTVDINVNGSVGLQAGFQVDKNNLTSINSLGSTQAAPFFDQNIQVSVTGKIGNKLKLSTDFDTQRAFDIDNQLNIRFGGQGTENDDAIIQFVEAGNVSMQTPSTLIGGSQTLFGVKTGMKFGKLLLTSILSQKRGERRVVKVSGGSVRNMICIKPYEYARNHFWLDTTYKTFYDDYYANTPPSATPRMARFKITDIEVYEQVKDGAAPSQFDAVAYADLEPIPAGSRYSDALRAPSTSAGSGVVQRGSFIRLEKGRGFTYNAQLGTVTIRSLQRDKFYAVAYRTADGQAHGELSNTRPDSNTVAVLKLIYVNNMQPSFTTLWSRQMKNIYQMQGVRNVDLDNSTIRITYGIPPDTSEVFGVEGGKRIVEVLGVDRVNTSNQAIPDGVFDIRVADYFNSVTGEVIFPSTEPFRKQLREKLGPGAESFILNSIYDQTRDEAQRDTRVGNYSICGEIAGTGGSRISLGTFGVAPNSVRVFKNGEALTKGVDYRVDPIVGRVTLISPRANAGSGELEIEFEQNDLFTTSVKTLVGLRADYDLYTKRRVKSKLGMTLMRYSQSLPTDKIQIYAGEEPVLNTGIGFDGAVNYEAQFLTDFVNAIPFIETDEKSEITFSGEWAAMLPEAKTQQELIDIDRGRNVAYIDDFESGAKRQIQLGINYTLWHHASPPVDNDLGVDDTTRVENKGLFWWYNISPSQTRTDEIWPNRDVLNDASTSSVLDVLFDPNRRGIYNPNPNYVNAPPLNESWGGIMRSLSFFTTNLNEENIDFIEITLDAREFDPNTTKVYLELGQISEDVIPNFSLDTEDGVTPENPQRDDVLNDGEDIGIDGLTDDQERIEYGTNEEDPARDNYFFDAFRSNNPEDYMRVNGLQGNVGQERGPFPDQEDLNSNRNVDLDNSYFRYEIDLNSDALTNPQIVGSGTGGWRQYRIPLRTGFTTVGSPSFANVQYARIVVKSPSRVHIRFAEMNLVGSEWRNMALEVGDSTIDPKLDISFVNLEDNGGAPDFYTLPPGVEAEIDDLTALRKNEQSLALSVSDLQRGESRGAIRVRPRSFDVFNYEKMHFYLHGAGDMDDGFIAAQPPKVITFVRFGWDSLNYYEYRVPLLRDWNAYEIDFDDLAAIKQDADFSTINEFPVAGKPGHSYVVRGLPSLTRIQFIAFGIVNNAWPGALKTTMWVNELRAVGAQGGADWAATVSASAKLADLAGINYNASRRNPNFHRLEERFGDRVDRTNWAFNSNVNLTKLLPGAMQRGSSIPFTYSHTERIENPRYIAESDVDVNAATERILGDLSLPSDVAQRRADSLRRSTETLVVQDALALSDISLKFPGENWIISDIVNKFNFGFLYDQTRERSPLIEQRFRWQWDFRGAWGTRIPENFDIKPFKGLLDSVLVLDFWKDFQINLLPTNVGTSVTLHRERTTEKLRELPDPSPVIRDFRATRSANFNWPIIRGGIINPTVDYNLAVRSSLTHLETDELGRQHTGSKLTGLFFLDEGRLFNFGLDNNMTQTFTFNSRPRIPFIPRAEQFFRPSASYKVDYKWDDQLGPTVGKGSYTKSAQYDARSTLGMTIMTQLLGEVLFGDRTVGRRGGRTSADTADRSVLNSILRVLIKAPLLDWDQFTVNFTQDNSAKNSGVLGGTGVSNLWGRSFLFRSETPDFGPGAAYQLGLTRYPHGTISFPWLGGDVERGLRAPNIYVDDNYSQKNDLTANTSRQLFPGMTLTLNWNTGWGFNQNYSVTTNGLGEATYSDYLTTYNLSRTYLSLPLFFDNDIGGVVNEYAVRKATIIEPILPANPTPEQQEEYNQAFTAYNRQITETLSDVFEEQLEAFNWLPESVRSFFPRANWRLQWNGLHNLPFMKGWAQRTSLTHEYRGQYNQNSRETTDGRVPETQTVSRGFQPLIGITITGNQDFWKGTASASFNYNTTSEFALVIAARSEISKKLRNEMQLRLSYQRRGLKLSILGLDLKNEVEFTTDFSMTRENTKRFNLTEFPPEGNNDGFTRISFRPAVRYTISRTVDATGFVSYEATIPDSEGSRNISRSTLKVGVDIRLKISGGR